jgi:hypothetical protein
MGRCRHCSARENINWEIDKIIDYTLRLSWCSPRKESALTLDAGAVFTRTVDELPVVGPGGTAMVKEIARRFLDRLGRPDQPLVLKLRTPEESIELPRAARLTPSHPAWAPLPTVGGGIADRLRAY